MIVVVVDNNSFVLQSRENNVGNARHAEGRRMKKGRSSAACVNQRTSKRAHEQKKKQKKGKWQHCERKKEREGETGRTIHKCNEANNRSCLRSLCFVSPCTQRSGHPRQKTENCRSRFGAYVSAKGKIENPMKNRLYARERGF